MSSNSTCFCILRYVQKLTNRMFSGLGPLEPYRKNVLYLFCCCSKESYGGEAVFVPDVDYFGDPYRGRSNLKKQDEKPHGSVCQETSVE